MGIKTRRKRGILQIYAYTNSIAKKFSLFNNYERQIIINCKVSTNKQVQEGQD
jgi:hypothetical protein